MTNAAILRFDRSFASRRERSPAYADASELARTEAPGAPLFCFSEGALQTQARAFLEGFPGEVAYAVKANPSKCVVAGLHRAGVRVWDVASVHEMEIVAGIVSGAEFHYHNPVKSAAEVREAYTRFDCRRFAVDCIEELEKIASVIPDTKNIEIAVRFVLSRAGGSSTHDFSSKFGASPVEAARLLRRASELGFLPALTFHPGSQCKDAQAYARHIHAAKTIASAAHVRLTVLNVGGGFPARYAGSCGPELGCYFAIINQAVEWEFGRDRPKLECEPGRALAASCMSLLTRVKLVRNGTDEVFLNDGVYGGLMEVSQAPELLPPYRVIGLAGETTASPRLVTVYGPTCDPLDRLPMKLAMPANLHEGDFIEFGTLGAYGSATTTRFNGYGDHGVVPVDRVFNI